MTISRDVVLDRLRQIGLPDGKNLVESGIVRALSVAGSHVSFVLEASPSMASRMEPVRAAAQSAVEGIPGVRRASVVLTAHSDKGNAPRREAGKGPPPSLKIGKHPTNDKGPKPIKGVRNVVAVASGKGGVGKSTVASNLAVAFARRGTRAGLLDADILGPSLHKMMGAGERGATSVGQLIRPLRTHGVTMMSIGLLLKPDEAVIWRGPMLMGALQQLLFQIDWGELDVLIVDLPPGTGDVQLTLCQRVRVAGAIVVCTPQDIALIDARRAISMFNRLKVPVAGIIENMSYYACPNCGQEAHIFGHGGARMEAERVGIPFIGEIPLAQDVREAGDCGMPIASSDSSYEAFANAAERLVASGLA
ncbi:MAG: Mrp/NBP35 family ATP-binding protein [Albidovulum sp.]|nr:Mrp/NBP35 family ATP-binding protein [Albidovulum sp.]